MNKIFDLTRKTFRAWSEDKASRLAAALAYYTFFSIPPLLVVIVGIAALFTERQLAENLLINQASRLIGREGAEAIATILDSADAPQRGELIPTAVGFILLLLGASGVFTQLQDAMNTVWNVEAKPGRTALDTIKERLLSFTMVLAVGFVLLVSLMMSAILNTFSDLVGQFVSETALILWITNLIISFGVITILFALMYKTIPDVKIAWRDVWIGAALTAALFKVGEFALSVYFERSDPTSAFGAAGSVILILLWVYYSAQILFLGAEFTQVYSSEYGMGANTESGAKSYTNEEKPKQATSTEIT